MAAGKIKNAAGKSRARVLVVDDDEFLLDLYAQKFSAAGYDAMLVAGGKEALKQLRLLPFDVVVLDILMPDPNGIEVLRKIREGGFAKGAKILILTNLGEEECKAQCHDLGADEYMIKANFTPSEVVDRVEALINKSPNAPSGHGHG